MKFSAITVVTLLASTCDAFTIPQPSATHAKTGFGSSPLSALRPRVFRLHREDSTTIDPFNFNTELGVSTLTPDFSNKDGSDVWNKFCNWVTSTENRLYIGWFGTLMFPTLLTAATCFIASMIAAPPGKYSIIFLILLFDSGQVFRPNTYSSYCLTHTVDIDGIREPVAGSLLYGNNIISASVVPSSNAIGMHFYPIWEAASLDEWLYNGGEYQLIVYHFLIGLASYMGREWELSYRLGMRPGSLWPSVLLLLLLLL
jgi:hypothetical protein